MPLNVAEVARLAVFDRETTETVHRRRQKRLRADLWLRWAKNWPSPANARHQGFWPDVDPQVMKLSPEDDAKAILRLAVCSRALLAQAGALHGDVVHVLGSGAPAGGAGLARPRPPRGLSIK